MNDRDGRRTRARAYDMTDFDAVAADKAERQAALIEALTSAPGADASSAREQLEQLLPAETLAELDERILVLVTGEGEPQPEPTLLDAAAAAKEAGQRTLVDALLGRRSPVPVGTRGSLDGGARPLADRPETHAETLARILRDRSADVGARF